MPIQRYRFSLAFPKALLGVAAVGVAAVVFGGGQACFETFSPSKCFDCCDVQDTCHPSEGVNVPCGDIRISPEIDLIYVRSAASGGREAPFEVYDLGEVSYLKYRCEPVPPNSPNDPPTGYTYCHAEGPAIFYCKGVHPTGPVCAQ